MITQVAEQKPEPRDVALNPDDAQLRDLFTDDQMNLELPFQKEEEKPIDLA